jgi:hypothetical protein
MKIVKFTRMRNIQILFRIAYTVVAGIAFYFLWVDFGLRGTRFWTGLIAFLASILLGILESNFAYKLFSCPRCQGSLASRRTTKPGAPVLYYCERCDVLLDAGERNID